MYNTIRDKRLSRIHTIESESDIFEKLQPLNITNEKLHEFISPFDSVFGGMFDYVLHHEEEEKGIRNFEETFNSYKDNPWQYADYISRCYDTCNFYPPVYEQCINILTTDENKWFEWIVSIPYAGIQRIFLQYAPSLQCLLHFVHYLQKHPDKTRNREYLISLLILEFIHKLKQIDGNIETENRSLRKAFIWDFNKWETESDSYISEFTDVLFQLPPEQLKNILLSMLSSIWVYDARRNKYDKKFRDKVLELVVDPLQTATEVESLIKDNHWNTTKSAILHKLLIYVQWSLNQNKKSNTCAELLWKQIVACLETEKTYLYYEQPDEKTLSWIFAKLLADEQKPLQKIESILKRYHQRYGIWNRDYENAFQMERSRYFFLTIGAMASEWLLQDERYKLEESASHPARSMINYIFNEGQLVIDGFLNNSKDELNFLVQFWARMALFQTKETTENEANKMLNSFNSIEDIDFQLTAILVFLKNLTTDNIGPWYRDVFAKGILGIIKKDIEILDHWNQKLAKDAERIKKRGQEIRLRVETLE